MGEIDEISEDKDGSYECAGKKNTAPANIVPSNAEALNAGLLFLKWIEDQGNVIEQEKVAMKRMVEFATLKSNAKKQCAITDYFRTLC